MMGFFTDAEVDELRDMADDAINCVVTIRAPGQQTYDPGTGRDTFVEGDIHYQGGAEFTALSPSRTPTVGEETRPYRSAKVYLPHTADLVHRDDMLTVDAAARNPALVDQTFRVLGVEFDADLVQWELTVEHVAGSRPS